MSVANQPVPVQRYFVPGEFFVVLRAPAQNNSNQKGRIIEATERFLSQTIRVEGTDNFLERFKRKIKAYEDPYTLTPEQRDKALEVVNRTLDNEEKIRRSLNTALANLKEDEDSVVLVGDRAHVFIQLQEGPLASEEDESILACFTGALELLASDREGVKIGAYTVIGVSLNWLMASSQGNLTSGGPGARPVPPYIEPGKPITREDWEIVEEPGRFAEKSKKPDIANVYILDTVPQYDQLTGAVQKWGKDNELIIRLLGSGFQPGMQKPASTAQDPQYYEFTGDPLTLHYYEKEDRDKVFRQPLDYGIDDQDYPMPDHGLFIAGIIHAQAECARLHMIQVLNEYGVGSFRALLWGLEKVDRALQPGEKAIVNSSLTYAADERSFKNEERPIGTFLYVLHLILGGTIDGGDTAPYMEQIEHLYKSLANGVVVVAAAGNDSRPGASPVPAQYPAAFAGVQGVGALLSDNQTRAPYSNNADTPLDEGFLTFGGDVCDTDADVNTGILSVFTNEIYPSSVHNETGWARWAGTSFATAVVAGAYAEQLCAGRDVLEADGELKKVRYQGNENQPFHLKRGQRRRNAASNPS